MKELLFCLFATILAFPGLAAESKPLPSLPEKTECPLAVEFNYSSSEEAAENWQPMTGSAAVEMVQAGPRQALRFPCSFAKSEIARASWDLPVKLNLSNSSGIEFSFFSYEISPVSRFTVYFHSGKGWYNAGFYPEQKGQWTRIRIPKTEFSNDNVSGWSAIDAIRISAWRGSSKDCDFHLADFSSYEAEDSAALLILNESSLRNRSSIHEYAKVTAKFLEELGVPFTPLSDLDLLPERLEGVKLLILPFCPSLSEESLIFLKDYLSKGGKILSFYILSPELCPQLGFAPREYVRQEYAGYFASIRPAKGAPLEGLPQITPQASWNIMDMRTASKEAKIAAFWYNAEGTATPYPAILVSQNAVHMTHVLLRDGGLEKRILLLSMISRLMPEALAQSARHSLKQCGIPGGFTNFGDAIAEVRKLVLASKMTPPPELAEASLRSENAAFMMENGNFREAIAEASAARANLAEAFCKAQTPLPGERRLIWCHSPTGIPGKTWDEAVRLLADNGFTDLIPNMLSGGAAWHPSKFLPAAPELDARGNLTKECLAACRKYGIKCHVWKLCWKLGDAAPQSFVNELRKQGRLQVSLSGKENLWLCPSNQQNQELEINSLLEVVREYDVDGIHLDYIRYPGQESCFCETCRSRFETQLGSPIENWPHAVFKTPELKGKWLQFRRDQITRVVEEISKEARKIKPGIQISAAVFPNAARNRDDVAQDWQLWCRKGYLDFVCPMDYTSNAAQFENWLDSQLKDAAPLPCYPGIGVGTWSDQDNAPRLVEQILLTRKHKTGGFTVFDYNANAANFLIPLCGQGITKKKKAVK